MIVAGASRHAKEILQLLHEQQLLENLFFFDDVNPMAPDFFYGQFPVVRSLPALKDKLLEDNRFLLALGNPINRQNVAKKIEAIGGKLTSIIAGNSSIGDYDVDIEKGVNIMQMAFISNSVSIGKGALINAFASIHHDVTIGFFTEISPKVTLLGGVKVGSYCSIGSAATILPNITVGDNSVVGAGSVVTKNVPPNTIVLGVPARVVKQLPVTVF